MPSPETTENALFSTERTQPTTPIIARSTRRNFLQTGVRVAIGTSALGVTTGIYAQTLAPARCTFPETELEVPRLPRAFDNFRVALFADLHLDEEPDTTRLERIVERVNAWQPDIVCLAGDYISLDAASIEAQLARALAKLRARSGVWATMGNHDHWGHDGSGHELTILRRVQKNTAVTELCNSHTTIERGDEKLILAGLDSYSGQPDLEGLHAKLLKNSSARDCTILLLHEPDYADITAPLGCFDLQLSGHSHGGQVVIPFVGPPILPPSGQKYHTGLYRVPYESEHGRGEMLQYTTCGAGTSGMRVRFNCPPEVSLLKLRAPQST